MDFLSDADPTMVAVLVFLAVATLTFCVMILLRAQGSIKRRAAGINVLDVQRDSGPRSLRSSSLKAAQRVIEYTAKHYATGNNAEMKVLRRRMMQAGIYDSR